MNTVMIAIHTECLMLIVELYILALGHSRKLKFSNNVHLTCKTNCIKIAILE